MTEPNKILEKVVIVEDHMPYYMTYKKVIEEMHSSCSIYHCHTEEKAIDAVSSDHNDFDLLILDGNLGGGHGRNVLAILSEEQLKKTVVCSSDDDFLLEAKSTEVRYIDKSCGIHRLEGKIRNIL